ncbi:FUSC family protein [Caulobacter sp. KR2-114]|uniref:FUSC family protein n=1 Tax=Caulobacter sp. KR2-114 TaxID=3400912 RepID=UPI003C072206
MTAAPEATAPAEERPARRRGALARRALALAAARRGELRHAVRVSVAVGVAFLLSTVFRLPQGYWAVFTAVIVVQTSLGGTIAASVDRLAGTMVGAALGAGAAYLKASTPLDEGLLLCGVVAVLAFAAAVRPSLKVAPITAVIVLIAGPRDVDPLHAALFRVIEIAIGSAVGVAATLFIFPARSHATVVRQLRAALLGLAEIVELQRRQLAGEALADQIQPRHLAVRTTLGKVEGAMAEAEHENATGLARERTSDALPRTLWRVRNDVVQVSRALDGAEQSAALDHIRPSAMSALAAAADLLRRCEAAAGAEKAVDMGAWTQRHADLVASVEQARAERLTASLSFDGAARFFGLVFALQTLARNLDDLADRVDELAGVAEEAKR